MLAEFYETMKEQEPGELEIVFTSSDVEAEAYYEDYKSMPWAALPYENHAARLHLAHHYGVHALPQLIVVDAATGIVKDGDGRSTVVACSGDIEQAVSAWRQNTL